MSSIQLIGTCNLLKRKFSQDINAVASKNATTVVLDDDEVKDDATDVNGDAQTHDRDGLPTPTPQYQGDTFNFDPDLNEDVQGSPQSRAEDDHQVTPKQEEKCKKGQMTYGDLGENVPFSRETRQEDRCAIPAPESSLVSYTTDPVSESTRRDCFENREDECTASASARSPVLTQPLSHTCSSASGPSAPTPTCSPSSPDRPAKRRRAKRTEEERIEHLRTDPYASQVEAYRVLCAGCDKWIRLRPNSTYCSIPWNAHRKSCLARRINNKNIYALDKRTELFSKDPDIREFETERVLCKLCNQWLDSGDHLGAVKAWLRHKGECTASTTMPVGEAKDGGEGSASTSPTGPAPSSPCDTVPRHSPASRPNWVVAPLSTTSSTFVRGSTPQTEVPEQDKPHLHDTIATNGGEGSPFHGLNHVNYTSGPTHETRKRNAEQRAATLRADSLIGTVEPNKVFCSLCQKWVRLRQDSSYCAYPWLQHRGKCVARHQRRAQKAAKISEAKARKLDGQHRAPAASHSVSYAAEQHLSSQHPSGATLQHAHRFQDPVSHQFIRNDQEKQYRRMQHPDAPRIEILSDADDSGEEGEGAGPDESESESDDELVSKVEGDRGWGNHLGDVGYDPCFNSSNNGWPGPRYLPHQLSFQSLNHSESEKRDVNAPHKSSPNVISSSHPNLDTPPGRHAFIHASILHLLGTTYEATDELRVNALVVYLNAAVPLDKHEDFDTGEVVRVLGVLSSDSNEETYGEEMGRRVKMEGDLIRIE